MNIRTIFDDEKVKLQTGQKCNYCGSTEYLALDHIFAKSIIKKDTAENLVYACRSCNSSKGKKDLMQWMQYRQSFLPLLIIRRYLKLVFLYCDGNGLLNLPLNNLEALDLPFEIEFIPTSFPNPAQLTLSID